MTDDTDTDTPNVAVQRAHIENVWIAPMNSNDHPLSSEVDTAQTDYYRYARFAPEQLLRIPGAQYVWDADIPDDIKAQIITDAMQQRPPRLDDNGNVTQTFPAVNAGKRLHKDLLAPYVITNPM